MKNEKHQSRPPWGHDFNQRIPKFPSASQSSIPIFSWMMTSQTRIVISILWRGQKRHAKIFLAKNIYDSRISDVWYHWYHDLLDFGSKTQIGPFWFTTPPQSQGFAETYDRFNWWTTAHLLHGNRSSKLKSFQANATSFFSLTKDLVSLKLTFSPLKIGGIGRRDPFFFGKAYIFSLAMPSFREAWVNRIQQKPLVGTHLAMCDHGIVGILHHLILEATGRWCSLENWMIFKFYIYHLLDGETSKRCEKKQKTKRCFNLRFQTERNEKENHLNQTFP